MLLRRLLHSSRHFRHGLLQTVAPAASASSPPLPFRRLPDLLLLPARVLSPRLLSTSGRDEDGGNKPWSFAGDSGDPDPFAHEDAAAADADADAAGEALPVGPAAVADEPWAKGFGAEDGESGDVFEGIYKEAASAAPASREAAPAGHEEPWTLTLKDEKDFFADAVTGEGVDGSEGGGLDEPDAGEDPEAELKRLKDMEREKELMEILKGDHLDLLKRFDFLVALMHILLYNLMKCRALKVQNRNQKHNNFLHLER
jgi:small subunit ribosomal protein S9